MAEPDTHLGPDALGVRTARRHDVEATQQPFGIEPAERADLPAHGTQSL